MCHCPPSTIHGSCRCLPLLSFFQGMTAGTVRRNASRQRQPSLFERITDSMICCPCWNPTLLMSMPHCAPANDPRRRRTPKPKRPMDDAQGQNVTPRLLCVRNAHTYLSFLRFFTRYASAFFHSGTFKSTSLCIVVNSLVLWLQ